MNKKNIFSAIFLVCLIIIFSLIIKTYYLTAQLNSRLMIYENQIYSLSSNVDRLEFQVNSLQTRIYEFKDESKNDYTQTDDKLMTIDELAEYLNVSDNYLLYNLDSIPHISMDNKNMFLKSSINEWIVSNQGALEDTSIMAPGHIMNPGQLSRYLGVTTAEVISWAEDAESGIPFFMNGDFYRFRKEEIDTWWNERQQNTQQNEK